ncbi:hypothetical protein [Enterococcus caccae]|uniref:Uncharacterized protein n=1 Tax=Enterococcus caccae ATCC BAA-1240 TaxID=1158612 RepID=R3WPP6_9ENTE|nr:hypothetical protein [Enterococcus caccae]EOL49382.1 hypothetical protein UC7_00759 [Enterococcus caccae ATCC BAA-1240]EOT56434.1 hypothetical protein I580_03234 [Enterococcus caccae ATCC BAA-1240]
MVKFEGFGRDKAKRFIYIIVIIGSISVCILGIRSNINKEYQRKVDYAKSTIKSESAKIKRLDKQVKQLYREDQEDFLMEPIDEEKLKSIERDIRTLKKEAVDFGLKDEDFSSNFVEVIQGEKELSTKIEDFNRKRTIQKQISELLVKAPVDWTANSPNIVINETASTATISQIRNEVSKSENNWTKAMSALLDEMDTQVKQYTELRRTIEAMIQDGALTSSMTVETFFLAISQLELVKNETLRQELANQLDIIDSLLKKQALGEVVTNQEEVLPSE